MRSFQKGEKIHARHDGLTAKCTMESPYPGYVGQPYFTGIVRPQWEALSLPAFTKKPTTWAVWNDLFHEGVPRDFRSYAIMAMFASPMHTFLVLTKRSARMVNPGLAFPPHIWLGVTAENQEMADLRIPELMKVNGNRWLSVEPMLGPVDLREWLHRNMPKGDPFEPHENYPALDWVVCGPETGKHKRPCDPRWIADLYEQCKAAGVPFFDKRKVGWLAREMPEGIR